MGIRIGPRFSNTVLQCIRQLVRREPPVGKRVFIIATSTVPVLDALSLPEIFDWVKSVPNVNTPQGLAAVVDGLNIPLEGPSTVEQIKKTYKKGMPIKKLITTLDMSCTGDRLTAD